MGPSVGHYTDRLIPSKSAKYLHRTIDQTDVSPYLCNGSRATHRTGRHASRLIQVEEKLVWHARTAMVDTCGTWPACRGDLVRLMQPRNPDRRHRAHEEDRLA